MVSVILRLLLSVVLCSVIMIGFVLDLICLYMLGSDGGIGGLLNLWMLVFVMKLWLVLMISIVWIVLLVCVVLIVLVRLCCMLVDSVFMGGWLIVMMSILLCCLCVMVLVGGVVGEFMVFFVEVVDVVGMI